jgi:hypothetical protein
MPATDSKFPIIAIQGGALRGDTRLAAGLVRLFRRAGLLAVHLVALDIPRGIAWVAMHILEEQHKAAKAAWIPGDEQLIPLQAKFRALTAAEAIELALDAGFCVVNGLVYCDGKPITGQSLGSQQVQDKLIAWRDDVGFWRKAKKMVNVYCAGFEGIVLLEVASVYGYKVDIAITLQGDATRTARRAKRRLANLRGRDHDMPPGVPRKAS